MEKTYLFNNVYMPTPTPKKVAWRTFKGAEIGLREGNFPLMLEFSAAF